MTLLPGQRFQMARRGLGGEREPARSWIVGCRARERTNASTMARVVLKTDTNVLMGHHRRVR